ncbi:hypothetical protein, variant 2 [Aphanomyces invadans]|uniref:Uncharacterized protein n=1 Tax=Aphanomyces invadans TaxID=157072 RepID=A0A024TUZ9_9STRA|nr:hypothetical protein, variant 2 [Aphanomyces invadans]ETV97858.1 hypothetical protein, variant 2 [Aphanomyces invadans]|eukprot:XP_008873419.1 hypothetical protein, variant 2 [Aphanomyces invadans]
MDKRKSGAASMAPRKKKVKISNVAGRIPISAFFKRIVRPTPEAEDAVPAGGNHVEEIDGEEPMDVTESKSSCSVRMVQGTINFDHANETKLKVLRRVTGFHMLRSRELRGGLPQRQQQQVLRDILKSFAALGVAPQPVLQPNQWISCMEFDTDGVILATGSSNGMIALYDFDEYFHRLLVLRNLQAKPLRQATNDAATHGTFKTVRPIHILNTALEIKRIRWNPMDQDILACSFTARNEIHLYNLKKFPTQPFRVLKAPTRPSSGYYDFLFTKSRTSNAPCIVGADVDGSIRMWDTHVPSKPVWVVVNSRDVGSITSMCLCAGQQYLICGTDRGWLLIFDTWNIVVPAFGQRPVPKRVAQYDLLVHLRGSFANRCWNRFYVVRSSGTDRCKQRDGGVGWGSGVCAARPQHRRHDCLPIAQRLDCCRGCPAPSCAPAPHCPSRRGCRSTCRSFIVRPHYILLRRARHLAVVERTEHTNRSVNVEASPVHGVVHVWRGHVYDRICQRQWPVHDRHAVATNGD